MHGTLVVRLVAQARRSLVDLVANVGTFGLGVKKLVRHPSCMTVV
jgi:hypothetical protein